MFNVKASEISLPAPCTCAFDDLDLSQAPSINAMQPNIGDWQGWYWFNNIGVSPETGTQLFVNETPLRASRIQLVVTDVGWRYGFSFATAVRTPLGRGTAVDESWRFPSLLRYGAVLFQPQGDTNQVIAHQLTDSSAAEPQIIELNPEWDVFVAINDQKQAYEDNNGSIDVYLRVLA